MKEQLLYYNNKGILKLDLNKYPYKSELSDLKDWSWGFNERFGNLESFYRDGVTKILSTVIAGDYLEPRDKLCDVFTADLIAGKPGKLVMNDWELDCYIVRAEHENRNELARKIQFTVRSEDATWVRKQTRTFNGTASGGGEVETDYGRDYTFVDGVVGRGYDYGYNVIETHFASIDLSGVDNGYEIIIYGPQTDPVIYIDGYPIKVNVEISALERLRVISNGRTKDIHILAANGAERDAFIYRDKEHSPFISLGEHTELTYGNIRFDFTAIERRSASTWT